VLGKHKALSSNPRSTRDKENWGEPLSKDRERLKEKGRIVAQIFKSKTIK
jgi:hypothetical protein